MRSLVLINAMRRILGAAGAGWSEGHTGTTTTWVWQEPIEPHRQVAVTETLHGPVDIDVSDGRSQWVARIPADALDLDLVLRTLDDWHVLPTGPCALDAVDRHAAVAMAVLTPDDPELAVLARACQEV